MNDSAFKEALLGLCKKQDSKTILKILVHIRREVEWPKNVENITELRQIGCLKHLVGILRMPQKHILDVCLSILGNCIMDEGCARETIGTYNILSPLNHILRRFPKEDSINGRIFRILGNMCQHRDQWANTILDRKPHIVMHVVRFVKNYSKDNNPIAEKYSEGSVIMAIRTLRLLLGSLTVVPLVKSFGVLKTVGCLLIKLSPQWQENRSKEGILNSIIRLLYDYSRYQCYHSILEMRNTERGDSLLHLCNVLLLSPRKIVKIIMNFFKIIQLKSELPVPEICDKFIEEVMKINYDTEEFKSECIEYIQCLCFLLEHPAVRNTERCANCLPLLIKVLQSFENGTNVEIECSILLIRTLNNFKYEDSLILEQLKCNIIQVVLSKLHWVVGNSETMDYQHKRVRKRKCSLKILRNLEMFIDDCLNFDFSFYELFQQPCPSGSGGASSPRSPPLSDDERQPERSPSPSSSVASNDGPSASWSPRLCCRPAAGDSDSDDYSPVCSEADPGECALLPDDEAASAAGEGDGGEEEEEEEVADADEVSTDKTPTEESSTTSLKARLIHEISKILLTYSRIRPPLPELGKEELLLALMKCSNYSSLPLVPTINALCRILKSQAYLIPLMKTRFIEKVYGLTIYQHNGCTKCVDQSWVGAMILQRFTLLAESAVGKGEIAHGLLRGTTEDKQKLALSIPYICKAELNLGKLMVDCGGLDILMRLLREDNGLKDRTIMVLSALSLKRLKIANPKEVAVTVEGRPAADEPRVPVHDGPDSVEFQLDDGSRMRADRQFLIEQSEYFRGLLDGHFKESGERTVRLHNVEYNSLHYLLQLMQFGERLHRAACKLEIATLLDVILLCDRYLLPDLCQGLLGCVERHVMTPRTVSTIYRWSLESGLDLLRVESIAFALVADVGVADRREMFESLFALDFADQLIDDIEKLLLRYLKRFAALPY